MMLRISGLLASLALTSVFAKPAMADEGEAPAPEGGVPAASNPSPKYAPPDELLKPESTRAPNSIYLEGLGAGLAYSINYERLVVEDLGVRAGLSYLSLSASAGDSSASASLTTIPVTVSYLGVGSKHHILELGGGMSFLLASAASSGFGRSSSGSGLGVLPDAMIGYRLHPVGHAGFQFRVGAMAFFGKGLGFSSDRDPDAIGVLPWFYLSLGASF
jgi:hypothetical protein